jgi:hypothetical protein
MKHFTKITKSIQPFSKLFLCVYINSETPTTGLISMGYAERLDVNNLWIT